MRTTPVSRKPPRDLLQELSDRVVGQPQALAQIVPFVQMHQAGLAPEGRPVGVFLLLGPTGTGKTRTVEVLAHALHSNEKCLIKVDCGEFQMEHEVAKLIGAPPGYLGHRETQPMLSQQKLNGVTSDRCDLALVLFDEIEKAAASMTRLLLGVLDKAVLRLGDNTTVNFERTIIFLTSNLGAEAMRKQLRPDFGFESMVKGGVGGAANSSKRLEEIGMNSVRRKFPPEFVNRIDSVITYRPLGQEALAAIVDQQIEALEQHICQRLQDQSFAIDVHPRARAFLLQKGTSDEYGARELKRTILRHLTQPLAAMVASGAILPGDTVRIDAQADRLLLEVEA
jgi:ATP-dependent Clp protease ATP-binding subunit ClpA